VLQRAQEHWKEIDEHIQWCDQRIAAHQKDEEQVQRAAELKDIGPVTASAVVATVGDFKQFKNAAQFGAWLGLTPRQNSSADKMISISAMDEAPCLWPAPGWQETGEPGR